MSSFPDETTPYVVNVPAAEAYNKRLLELYRLFEELTKPKPSPSICPF